MYKNKLLFAISSLGLGHATRTLVVINYYIDKGYEIDLICFGNALVFLKSELEGKKINFIEFIDYPCLERGKGIYFYYYLIIDLIKTIYLIKKENKFVKSLGNKYDFIFSDGKYGVYSKNIPSFLLIHQLSFIMPKYLGFFSKISDYFNYKSFKKFNHIFISDYENINNSLAGKLSHSTRINKLNYSYIGILSSYYNIEKKENQKIDYLFTITGYLQENKQSFIDKLIKEANILNGKKVFILGNTKKNYVKNLDNDITIYSFVSGEKRKKLFLNADIIISRAGYTTIMDIIELGKKSILFPTPNQTEQEYLAEFLSEKGFYVFGNDKSDLIELSNKVNNSKIFETNFKTKISLEKINEIILKYI